MSFSFPLLFLLSSFLLRLNGNFFLLFLPLLRLRLRLRLLKLELEPELGEDRLSRLVRSLPLSFSLLLIFLSFFLLLIREYILPYFLVCPEHTCNIRFSIFDFLHIRTYIYIQYIQNIQYDTIRLHKNTSFFSGLFFDCLFGGGFGVRIKLWTGFRLEFS